MNLYKRKELHKEMFVLYKQLFLKSTIINVNFCKNIYCLIISIYLCYLNCLINRLDYQLQYNDNEISQKYKQQKEGIYSE